SSRVPELLRTRTLASRTRAGAAKERRLQSSCHAVRSRASTHPVAGESRSGLYAKISYSMANRLRDEEINIHRCTTCVETLLRRTSMKWVTREKAKVDRIACPRSEERRGGKERVGGW